ncbi:MAG: hypothetical protein HKO59_03635 [Phycisphaerales bacterium]|nr:hypothetical protein [Phycisphaerae bacterium]NNF44446.1 hypothetical protein [Phycisphaerales bacterium]NNM25073.1 hypothetical protein [Phycisphaerales bacterium]
MPSPDDIAREAARLVATGVSADVTHAIRLATERLGPSDAHAPGSGRVRAHLRAMTEQTLGAEGYRAEVRRVWSIAETLMTLIEETLPDARTTLAGRGAEGKIDGGVTLHLRVGTERPLAELVDRLVTHGYEEPAFETANTRFGRLDRIRFVEEGTPVVVTRCLPSIRVEEQRDLFEGRPISVLDLDGVRARLDVSPPPAAP